MEYDDLNLLEDEFSYQQLSDDIHKKLLTKWYKLKRELDKSNLQEDVREAVKDFDSNITYFFE